MDQKPSYFFVLGLPASGLAWIANFLTYARSICYMNPSGHLEDIAELPALFEISKKPFQGAADSLFTLFHREIQETFDAPPIVLIERDYGEVLREIARFGVGETVIMESMRREMPKIKAYDNTLTIPYAELEHEAGCRRLWEHCLPGEKHNSLRWSLLSDLIVEANMAKLARLVGTNLGKMHKLVVSGLKRETT